MKTLLIVTTAAFVLIAPATVWASDDEDLKWMASCAGYYQAVAEINADNQQAATEARTMSTDYERAASIVADKIDPETAEDKVLDMIGMNKQMTLDDHTNGTKTYDEVRAECETKVAPMRDRIISGGE